MKILIVEDERPAAERLQLLLNNYDPAIRIVGMLESIEETVRFLEGNPHPDLILLDIHLSDGHSFEIFKQVSYSRAIIFVTAYDNYALEAFRFAFRVAFRNERTVGKVGERPLGGCRPENACVR